MPVGAGLGRSVPVGAGTPRCRPVPAPLTDRKKRCTLGISNLTIRKAIELNSNSNGNIEVTFLNRVSNLLGILPRCESLFSHVEFDEFFF